jgi:serine/threonine protein kinase
MPLYPATLQHMPKPLPAQDVLVIGKQVLDGLLHMHQCGWAHCDVKVGMLCVLLMTQCSAP